jgi:hypothetical protein
MMQHQVAVQARFNPETLERVLRVVPSSWFSDLLYEYGDGHRRAKHQYRINCQPAAGRLTV